MLVAHTAFNKGIKDRGWSEWTAWQLVEEF